MPTFFTQKKLENEEGKEETYVAALSVSEQVLLKTCKLKIIAPDRSSTIARALIDPGSSALFVHERIAQHLRLSHSSKNVSVEGVAGTSMCTPGSAWFQVSAVEDVAVKIGVVSYILEMITKDLPLHPILVVLKWHHISGLELADSCLRTPACIDLLLGGEIFMNIVHHGRGTGP